jgi:hypothetical protein
MNTTTNEPQRTIPEMFSRGFWMMFGPLLLIPLAFKIVEHGQGWFTPYDIAFLLILAGMLAARGFEFYKGAPRTAEGQPATSDHFKRYALGVVTIGLACWVVTNLLANHWLAA